MEQRSKREVLAESPLLDILLTTELTMLAYLFSIREFGPGDIVFNEGEVGDSLFVIAEGAVEVLHRSPNGERVVIAELEAPQFFGEMSLIDKEYRSASVRSKTNTQLLQLSNENLHVFAKNYRNGFTWVIVNIARVLSSRMRETNRRYAEALAR